MAGRHYTLAQVKLVIGGYVIGGYAGDGGVEMEYGSDLGEMITGADGETTFVEFLDHSMIATVTVMETARSYRDLATLARIQMVTNPKPAVTFLLRDLNNGDSVSEPNAVFLALPAPSKGKNPGERVFKIGLPSGRKDIKLGSNIQI